METILYLTDFYYAANGRAYYQEDLFLTAKLKEHFNLLIGHPHQVLSYLHCADLIVFRNTGSVLGYQDYFQQFLKAVEEKNIPTFNSFDGKADIRGKQYLLDLGAAGFPVIPTIENVSDIEKLGTPQNYIVKLKNGADSIGMEVLTKEALMQAQPAGKLIQPYVPFVYEVSFYYLNNAFQYALYAPDKQQRWQLEAYEPTPADLAFADSFIQWNNLQRGISRVDACRLQDGTLLLVELEDLNPFLSIDLVSENQRNTFISNWIKVLKEIA